jgi:hypothetical protein
MSRCFPASFCQSCARLPCFHTVLRPPHDEACFHRVSPATLPCGPSSSVKLLVIWKNRPVKVSPFAGHPTGSVARPKLLQESSRRNEVVCLESFRESVEERVEKFERFVSLGPISPEFREADANTQF